MRVIGITGSFGTGKTFVASIFRSLGAKVLDADRIAHRTIRKEESAYRKIVKIFGKGILDARRNIKRRALAEIAFRDKKRLAALNGIIHPEVIKFIKERIRASGEDDVIIIDAPLLAEARLTGMVDTLIVVKASRRRQIERCVKKHRMARADVMRRIENQIPIKEKIKLADFVIDNDGPKSRTRKQAIKIWKEIVWR